MTPLKFGLAFLGDRLIAAAVRGSHVDTFVVEAEQPAAALRAELETRRLAPRRVALGLARAAVIVKPIDLPAIDGPLQDMVRFELERHLAFPAEDAASAWIPLPARADGHGAGTALEGTRVLVTAAERRVVESALRIVDDARLRPVSVTVAAHDLLGLVRADRARRVAWIHRTGGVADLLFIADGTLVLSRSTHAADGPRIAEEITRSFGVLRWRECDAIWLSGDPESSIASLATLATTVGEPPYTERARRLLANVGEAPRGAAELAIAVAARRRVPQLDLMPMQRRPRRLSRGEKVTIGAAAAALVLGLTALLYPGYRTSRHLEAVNAMVARLTPEVRAVERTLQELERKRRLLTTVESVESASMRPLPVLRELTELLPTEAWLTALSLDAKGVELTGQASAASALIPILENSPTLERVEFASPVTRGRDKEQFRIRAAWESSGGRPPVAAASPATSPARAAVGPGNRTSAAGPR